MFPKQSNTLKSAHRLFGLAASSIALVLSACASISHLPPEDQVRQRVAERWKALAARDFERAYAYNTPGFRGLVGVEAYRNRFGNGLVWVGGEAFGVNCLPTAAKTKCEVRVRIDYKTLLGGRPGDTLSSYIDETWLLEDGQWWKFEPINSN